MAWDRFGVHLANQSELTDSGVKQLASKLSGYIGASDKIIGRFLFRRTCTKPEGESLVSFPDGEEPNCTT